ncbi:hypothetical protein ACLB2K_015719 [Fragaria x ananassa]
MATFFQAPWPCSSSAISISSALTSTVPSMTSLYASVPYSLYASAPSHAEERESIPREVRKMQKKGNITEEKDVKGFLDILLDIVEGESMSHLRLRRDSFRFNSLTSLAYNRTRPGPPSSRFSSSIVSGLSQGNGEYFTDPVFDPRKSSSFSSLPCSSPLCRHLDSPGCSSL